MSAKIKNGIIVVVVLCSLFAIWYYKNNNPGLFDTQPVKTKSAPANDQRSFSYLDILNNPEFRSEMQDAVSNFDLEKAKMLQQKAIEIALVAQLPAEELNIIKGDKGLMYMQFLAKRQLFLVGFERRYKQLGGINDIKAMYPEAKDLFERSDRLIAQRDAEIKAIATELADGAAIDDYLYLAKQQWLQAANQDTQAN